MKPGWAEVALGDLLTGARIFTDGDWVESKDQDPLGRVRLVQLADIGDGEFLDKSSRYLTIEKADQLRCTYLEPGDILIARMPDPLGRACQYPGSSRPAVTVVDVCIVRVDPQRTNPGWLTHTLNSDGVRKQVAKLATGTTRSRVSRGNLKKVVVPLPPLEEQKRIAGILDKADELLAKRRAAIAHLDSLTQAIFLDMFGDPATNPRGWPVAPLEELVGAVNDCPHSTPRWSEQGIICLRTSNLGRGTWNWTETRYVHESTYSERSTRGELQGGDVVLSREGTVGIAAIVPLELRMCMGQRLVQVRPNPDVLGSVPLLWFLLEALSPRSISRLMVGSTAKHLNVRDLKHLPVYVMPTDAQKDFTERARRVGAQKVVLQTALASTESTVASLQTRAIRGEL